MTTQVIEESQMPMEMDAKIRRALGECFPNDAATFGGTRAWHGSAPFVTVVAVDEQGDVIGHMGLHDRTIDVGGVPVHVAGLQNVAIVPGHRKTGLLGKLMAITMGEAGKRNYDAGLLFCLPVLQRVYARVGWYEQPGRSVTRVDEHGVESPLPNNDVAMFYPLKLQSFPPGDIHLNGNDW